jgi:double-stranded uracil-DNA glycosylase
LRNLWRDAGSTPGNEEKSLLFSRSGVSRSVPSTANRPVNQGATQLTRPELPDYLRPGLDLVFVGFNPGDRSSRIGHYYAGRGNQFWNFLFASGLVAEKLEPEEDHRILDFGIGLTDVVKRWSPSSSSLRRVDYQQGVPRLIAKLRDARPRLVAFNGKQAYEQVVGRAVRLGLQTETLEGARVFVLPSTSGRNGSLTRRAKLAYFRRLARQAKAGASGVPRKANRGTGRVDQAGRGFVVVSNRCGSSSSEVRLETYE